MARVTGDYATARALTRGSRALLRALGDDREVAHKTQLLGLIAHEEGHWDEARACYAEFLQLSRTLGDQLGMVTSLVACSYLAADQGEAVRALRLAGAAAALEASGIVMPSARGINRANWACALAAARAALGDAWAAAFAAGQALPLDAALDEALQGLTEPADSAETDVLVGG